MYQSLIESSDLRVTIFCPGLSGNADLATQQHHLPRKDEFACLEAVEVDA